MIHCCRVCNRCAGGLVTEECRHLSAPQFDWPALDLCPACAANPQNVKEHDDAEVAHIVALVKEAQRQVAPIAAREREGEHIGQGLMEFRMR
jgi:hypothetical protein